MEILVRNIRNFVLSKFSINVGKCITNIGVGLGSFQQFVIDKGSLFLWFVIAGIDCACWMITVETVAGRVLIKTASRAVIHLFIHFILLLLNYFWNRISLSKTNFNRTLNSFENRYTDNFRFQQNKWRYNFTSGNLITVIIFNFVDLKTGAFSPYSKQKLSKYLYLLVFNFFF